MTNSYLSRALGIVLAIAVVAAAVLFLIPGHDQKKLTAEFPRTVSLYDGSDVRILGVKVGKVDSVVPTGTTVVVKMSYDAKYKVPKDAKAVLISPAIVGDRYIQLTPVYKSGAVMADNTRLGVNRTATPLELDQIYSSLNDLSKALGPNGANQVDGSGTGALTRLLDSTSRNFGGQGVQFNTTVQNLGKLTQTLDDNKDNLFGTARELETFVNTLAKNDTTVRRFNDSLASGADLLADERKDLAAALKNLATALTQVKGFVQDNKSLLSKNIKNINTIAKIAVKRRSALDETLRNAPDALNNLGLAYNPKTGTLDTRANVGQNISQLVTKPSAVLCSYIAQDKGPISASECATLVKTLGLPRAGALKRSSTPDDPNRFVDRSLAGLVVAKR